MTAVDDAVAASYDAAFTEAAGDGTSVYGAMNPMTMAAHERRIELLDKVALGDISNATCVDYGVGSGGFACIYPKVQRCGFAIGLDLSAQALRDSATVSAAGDSPYGDRWCYTLATKGPVGLRDDTVDVFFAGECIEHIENTDMFLDEIHRVMKPSGKLILTTPNADAYLYKIRSEHCGVGPEHLALLSYAELLAYLRDRFEVVEAHGYNFSLHHEWDQQINDPEVSRAWASEFKDRPDLATGVVVVARPLRGYKHRRYSEATFRHDHSALQYSGRWEVANLHRLITGRMGLDGPKSSISFEAIGDGLVLTFWCHDWSGRVSITVDSQEYELDLYEPVGGFRRMHLRELEHGRHHVVIRGQISANPLSHSNQLIFYQAVVYQRT